jgi:phage baseplate assembly protein gpV
MDDKLLQGLVRMGVVTEVDAEARRVLARYPDTGIVSGWLYVPQHPGAGVAVSPDGAHTHELTEGSASEAPDHDHTGTRLTVWLPNIGDRVLALYVPVWDGDGYVLGAI